MIVTELTLIRHGQAHCNVAGVVGGPRTCTGLTDLGRRQIALAARRLAVEHAQVPFHALYAGPRLRLQQTGHLLADALGLPLIVEPALDGPEHGDADGQPWHVIKTAFHGGPPRPPRPALGTRLRHLERLPASRKDRSGRAGPAPPRAACPARRTR